MSDSFADFLPASWRERRGRRRFLLIRLALVLAVGSLLGAHGFMASRARAADRTRVADGERRYQLAVGRIAEVEQLEFKKAQLSERLDDLRGVLGHVRGANVVHAVGTACTPSVSLSRLELGYVAEGGSERVMTISLEGICPDTKEVTAFERLLHSDPCLSSARMVRTEPIDAYRDEKKFLITAVASPLNLRDVVDGEPDSPRDTESFDDEAPQGPVPPPAEESGP